MEHKEKIVILGGGNGAFAAAADLTLKGYPVRLLEAPEFCQTIESVRQAGGIQLENPGVPGTASGFACVPVVTTDAEEAMDGADLVLYIVPGFGERRFTSLIAPYIRPEQLVVMFCGVFGGALELARTLRSAGITALPCIAETEALIYGAMKTGPASVRINGRKSGMAVAALPASDNQVILERLRGMWEDLVPATHVIETGIRNLNLVLHPPISILNAGRADPSAAPFRYYREGVTQPVGRVLEGLDRERVQVGQALGLTLPSTRERLLEWYGNQGASGETLGEIVPTNPAYQSLVAPQTLDHRFITEDVPFGLVPLEELGRGLDVPTPVTSALVTLAGKLLDRDFRTEGRNLKRLGLSGLDLQQMKELLIEPTRS